MSVLNPFQVSRSHLHSNAHQLQQWITSGHTQLPTSLHMQNNDRATAAVSDTSSLLPSSASVIYPDTALRAPCFYQLFPQLWKKDRKARPLQSHPPAASSSATASSASIAAISTSAAAAAAHDGSASGTALSNASPSSSNPSSAANAAPAPKLKLRARSPSLSLMHSLGACHSRLQHEAGFAEALSLATPHVSAQLSNINPNNQLEDGAPNDAVQPISPTIPPGSSLPQLDPTANSMGGATGPRTTLHRRASKFHKPVGEMGDYTTLMRNTVYLRNPYIDQLDDPAFVAYITHNLQMAAREKQQQQQQQQMLMNQVNDEQMQDTASAGSTSPSADSLKSPSRLTVDEADLSGEEAAAAVSRETAVTEPFNANPSPQFRRRNRNANGGIGRNIPRVSFQQFVQNKANAANTSSLSNSVSAPFPDTSASIAEESVDTSMTSGETITEDSQATAGENGSSDSRDSKRTKLSNSVTSSSASSSTLDSSVSDSTTTPVTPTESTNSSSFVATTTMTSSDEFTPSISSLLSSMLAQQQQAKANAQARAAANRELATTATVSLPPGASTSLLILDRLKQDIPLPSSPKILSFDSHNNINSNHNSNHLKDYMEAVNAWFVQQLLDLRSSRSCNEQAFGSSHVISPQLERTYEMAFEKWKQYSTNAIISAASNASSSLAQGDSSNAVAVVQLVNNCNWKKIKMSAMSAVVTNALSSS